MGEKNFLRIPSAPARSLLGEEQARKRVDYGVSQSLAQRLCTFERRQARIDQGVRKAEDAARAPDCEESVSATTRDDCALRRRYGSTPKYMFHLLQSSTSANYLVSI